MQNPEASDSSKTPEFELAPCNVEVGSFQIPCRIVIVGLILVILARMVVSIGSDAGREWDFVNFYNTGSRIVDGDIENLFTPATPPGEPPELRYVGFPLSAFLFVPLGLLSPPAALTFFKATCAVFMTLGLLMLFWYCRKNHPAIFGSESALLWYLVFILLAEPFWFVFVIGGQATPLAFLLSVTFLVTHVSDRTWWSSLALFVAVLVKPFLVMWVLVLLVSGERGLAAKLAVWSVLTVSISLYLFGLNLHLEWVGVVLDEGARWATRWWNNASVLGFLSNFWTYSATETRFGISPMPEAFSVLQRVYKVVVLMVIVSWAFLSGKKRWPKFLSVENSTILGLWLSLLFPTVVWPHYLQFYFVTLMLVAGRLEALSRRALVLLSGAVLLSMRADLFLGFVLHVSFSPPTSVVHTALLGFLSSGALILTLLLILTLPRQVLLLDPGRA